MSNFKPVKETLEVTFNLDAQQLLELHALSGSCSNLTEIFEDTEELLEEIYGISIGSNCAINTQLKNFIEKDGYPQGGYVFDHVGFQNKCAKVVAEKAPKTRKKVAVGDKEYYEDELKLALAKIKPIE